MTVFDLLTNDTFIGLCKVWEDEGRCPEPMIDLLLDHSLEDEANTARWAVAEPDRPVSRQVRSGRPQPRRVSGRWSWWVVLGNESHPYDADDLIKSKCIDWNKLMLHYKSFAETIATLFTYYRPYSNEPTDLNLQPVHTDRSTDRRGPTVNTDDADST